MKTASFLLLAALPGGRRAEQEAGGHFLPSLLAVQVLFLYADIFVLVKKYFCLFYKKYLRNA